MQIFLSGNYNFFKKFSEYNRIFSIKTAGKIQICGQKKRPTLQSGVNIEVVAGAGIEPATGGL